MRKAKPTDSFFNFFSPPTPPSDDEDLDEEDLEEVEEKLEIDYQIGEDLKEKVKLLCSPYCHRAHTAQVIPRAIDYFTGKALEYDLLEDDDDFDELDEDDDDQFDDDV